MQIELIAVDNLIPYTRNARTHSPDQIAQIAASIAEFGFTNPILIGADDVIIAGHGRLMAAQRLGLAEVPVIVLDHLTDTQRRALVIADNRIAENAGWDDELLRSELAALQGLDFDLDLVGFSDKARPSVRSYAASALVPYIFNMILLIVPFPSWERPNRSKFVTINHRPKFFANSGTNARGSVLPLIPV